MSQLAEAVGAVDQKRAAKALVQAVLHGHCGYYALEPLVLAQIEVRSNVGRNRAVRF